MYIFFFIRAKFLNNSEIDFSTVIITFTLLLLCNNIIHPDILIKLFSVLHLELFSENINLSLVSNLK